MNDFEAYRVNGMPADCVALCAYHWDKVDILRLGLNLGENLGHFVWHYRTLAAAKQAALLGIRGFTLRTSTRKREPDVAKLKPYVQETLDALLREPRLLLVNVNFPIKPPGFRWTRQSVTIYDGKVMLGTDPMDRKHFWFTVTPNEETEKGIDCWGCKERVSIHDALRLDLTNTEAL